MGPANPFDVIAIKTYSVQKDEFKREIADFQKYKM